MMPLAKPWRTLDRETVARAPQRYGIYELGDEEGTVVAVESGVLKRDIKSALAYADASKVRWEETGTEARADELAAEHRDRL